MIFSQNDNEKIIEAIKHAETNTSGEIKVHIEKKCPVENPLERAKRVFAHLCLHQTAQKNGVLFYLAYEDKKFAILGDEGIDKVVPEGFWESTRDMLRLSFSQGNFSEGLQLGIREAGYQLKKYFPYHSDDVNEISDDISTDLIP